MKFTGHRMGANGSAIATEEARPSPASGRARRAERARGRQGAAGATRARAASTPRRATRTHKVVDRLLESPYPVESLLVTPRALARIRHLLGARPETIQVFLAQTKAEIDAVTGFRSEDVKAVGRLARAPTLGDGLREAPRPHLFAAVDGITNTENVGVVVRNAAGLGTQALLVSDAPCSPFLTRAIRTSMGAVFRLPTVEGLALPATLARLRAEGVQSVAAHPSATMRLLPDVDLRGDACVVLGSEGVGVSRAVLRACDEAVAVPMASGVDSLNVGSAAAAFFYEAWRRRR
jgi:tRNA G18 (ribose-2'-O)-methylase SpoU